MDASRPLNLPGTGGKGRPGKAELNQEITPRFSWLQTLEVPGEDNDAVCLNCPRCVSSPEA